MEESFSKEPKKSWVKTKGLFGWTRGAWTAILVSLVVVAAAAVVAVIALTKEETPNIIARYSYYEQTSTKDTNYELDLEEDNTFVFSLRQNLKDSEGGTTGGYRVQASGEYEFVNPTIVLTYDKYEVTPIKSDGEDGETFSNLSDDNQIAVSWHNGHIIWDDGEDKIILSNPSPSSSNVENKTLYNAQVSLLRHNVDTSTSEEETLARIYISSIEIKDKTKAIITSKAYYLDINNGKMYNINGDAEISEIDGYEDAVSQTVENKIVANQDMDGYVSIESEELGSVKARLFADEIIIGENLFKKASGKYLAAVSTAEGKITTDDGTDYSAIKIIAVEKTGEAKIIASKEENFKFFASETTGSLNYNLKVGKQTFSRLNLDGYHFATANGNVQIGNIIKISDEEYHLYRTSFNAGNVSISTTGDIDIEVYTLDGVRVDSIPFVVKNNNTEYFFVVRLKKSSSWTPESNTGFTLSFSLT